MTEKEKQKSNMSEFGACEINDSIGIEKRGNKQ